MANGAGISRHPAAPPLDRSSTVEIYLSPILREIGLKSVPPVIFLPSRDLHRTNRDVRSRLRERFPFAVRPDDREEAIGRCKGRNLMTLFDKICAVPALIFSVVLLLLGAIGFFLGSSANFSLPPILGCLPFFVGWGIFRSVLIAWRSSNQNRTFEDNLHDLEMKPRNSSH